MWILISKMTYLNEIRLNDLVTEANYIFSRVIGLPYSQTSTLFAPVLMHLFSSLRLLLLLLLCYFNVGISFGVFEILPTYLPIASRYLRMGSNRFSCLLHRYISNGQCDQIGRFIALWATFQSLRQQLFFPNCPHF